MGINQSVFPSKSEKSNYYKIYKNWGKEYHIYTNQPYLVIFNRNNVNITDIEFNRLKKTSIDYTICDANDKPLICIEYDGMQEGFNSGEKYFSKTGSDVWRKEIMELKLKVALGAGFPFIVIGSAYFYEMSKNDKYSIVDCIIGEVLANYDMENKFAIPIDTASLGYTEDEFETLTKEQQNAVIEHYCIGIEVGSRLEKNPLYKLSHDLTTKLGVVRFSEKFLSTSSNNSNDERYLGAECTACSEKYGEAKGVVWLPKFNIPLLSIYTLIGELAKYASLKKLEEKA